MWETDGWSEVLTIKGHAGAVRACAVTPDGHLVVSASADRTLRVWSTSTGDPVAALHPLYPLRAAAVHPWLPRIAFGDEDGVLYRAELLGVECAALRS